MVNAALKKRWREGQDELGEPDARRRRPQQVPPYVWRVQKDVVPRAEATERDARPGGVRRDTENRAVEVHVRHNYPAPFATHNASGRKT